MGQTAKSRRPDPRELASAKVVEDEVDAPPRLAPDEGAGGEVRPVLQRQEVRDDLGGAQLPGAHEVGELDPLVNARMDLAVEREHRIASAQLRCAAEELDVGR